MTPPTMSGPATRPNVAESHESSENVAGFEPVVLPRYHARLIIERDHGEHIVSVTITGSSRIVDQIMHGVSDAFREEVET